MFDTNALATTCCKEAAGITPTLAMRLRSTGRVPFFVADHIPGEMDRRLAEIAGKQGVDPEKAALVWRLRVAPLVRVVELPIGEYLRPEIATIRRPKPEGDPKDWPSLAVAAFLGPSVILTSDHVFHRLGYANESDTWAGTAQVLRRVAELEGEQIDRLVFSLTGIRLTFAGVGGLVSLGRLYPWAAGLVGLAALLLAPRVWQSRDKLKAGFGELRELVAPYFRQIVDDLAKYAELRAELVTVQDPPWRSATITEHCARALARSGEPMTPGDLRDFMNRGAGERVTAAGLKRIMVAHPAFVRLPGDRYQVGRPLYGR